VAVAHLLTTTATPGVVYPVGTSALPNQLQPIPGINSYFVSQYTTGVQLANNVKAGGEMALLRTDQGIGKGYNFIFGTSSNGLVVFNGPHFNFPAHHFATSSPVDVAKIFGNIPLGNKNSTQ
jgi:hypothetical protein